MNERFVKLFTKLKEFEDFCNRPFPSKAYANAVKIFSNLPFEVIDANQIKGIPGIGDAIYKKTDALINDLPIPRYEEYLQSDAAKCSELAEIKGIGFNKAKKLFNAGITSVEQLKEIASKLKVGDMIGGSEVKLTKAVKIGIDFEAHTDKNRMTVEEHDSVANPLLEMICKIPGVEHALAVGSRRRYDGSEGYTIGDIDIDISYDGDLKSIQKKLEESLDEVVMSGETKVSGIKSRRQIDYRVVKPSQYGSVILHATGPAKWNVECRKIAIKNGMILNEYGLFERDTIRLIESGSEKAILEKLGIGWVDPKDRVNYIF